MFDETDLQILSILMSSNEVITSKILSFETLLSVKTIRKRVNKLSTILIDHGAQINMKQGTGISFTIFDEALFEAFRNKYMENPKMIQNQNNLTNELIDILVSQSDYVKAEYLTEVLFISRTKLTQSLKNIRTVLGYYNLTLRSKPYYGLKILGSEFNFRRFLASNYVQKYQLGKNQALFHQFDTKEKEAYLELREGIRAIVEEQLAIQKYSMHLNLVNNFIDHLFITATRIKKGMHIDTKLNIEYSESNQEEYRLIENIIKKIEDRYNIQFSVEEYEYCMIHLIGKRVLEVSDRQKISSEVNQLVEHILMRIKDSKNIDLMDDLDLRTMLALHIVPLITRIKNGIELKNPIIEEVKICCIAGYDLAIICSEVINEAFSAGISEHEISYFALHFDVALNKGEAAIRKKRILVVCSTGRASAQMLRYKFEHHFSPYLEEVTVCDINDLHLHLEVRHYDYCFTTVPIKRETLIPVFEFDFFLNSETLSRIESLLTGRKDADKIHRLFSENLFFSNINVNSREAALTYLFKKIREVKELPEGFEDVVWERENFFGTDIINNIAFPHPNKLITDDTFVAVMVLRKPISWEKNKVRLVFLISISKVDSDQYRYIFERLMNVLSSKVTVQKIVNESSYQVLMQELMGFDETEKG